jgi:putative ABC transport system permease protein
LGTAPGGAVELALPGGARPLALRVGGIADLSRARVLFNSRKGTKLEDFLYVADSVVVSPDVFRKRVVPAFRAATAARGNALAVKSVPILEVDVRVERSRLDADPGTALRQTLAIAKAIKDVAPEQDFLLDNVSNTLRVARLDAAVAKRMFLFLGLPGLLLAAFLAAYAGSILATTQRREQANLRLRGAHRGHLVRIRSRHACRIRVRGRDPRAYGAVRGGSRRARDIRARRRHGGRPRHRSRVVRARPSRAEAGGQR